MQPEHRIDELIVDLSFTTTRLARHEKALLSDWLSEDLLPALDQLFSRYSPGQQVLRFETLEFDFGNLTNRNYQQSIREQLLQKFAQLLQTQLLAVVPTHLRLPEHANSGDNPNARIALTQLFNYLASGQLSAHQPFEQSTRPAGRELISAGNVNRSTLNGGIVKQNALHEQLLDAVIAQHNIAELLRELPQRDALIQRLLTQFSVPQRLELLRQLAPQQVHNAIALLDLLQFLESNAINSVSQQLDSDGVWQALLQLGLEHPQANADFWLRHIFRIVAANAAIDVNQLQQHLVAIRIPFSSAARSLINLQTQIAQLSVSKNASINEAFFADNFSDNFLENYTGEPNGQFGAQQNNPDQSTLELSNPEQLNPEQFNSGQSTPEQLRQLIAAAFIRTDVSQLQQLWPQLITNQSPVLLAALKHYLPQAEIRQQLMLRLPLFMQADVIALLAPALKEVFLQLQKKSAQLIELLQAQIAIASEIKNTAVTSNAVGLTDQSPELLLRQLWEIALGLIFNYQSAPVNADYVGDRDLFVMALAARYADLHNLDIKMVQHVFDSLINQPQINQSQTNQYTRINPVDLHERSIELHGNIATPNTQELIKPEVLSVFVAASTTFNEPVTTSDENRPQQNLAQISYSSTSSLNSISDHQLFDLCLRLKSGALAWSSLANDIPLLQRLISSYIRLGHSATAENCADFVAAINGKAESSNAPSAYYLAVLQTLIADKLIDLEAIALGVQRNAYPAAVISKIKIETGEQTLVREEVTVQASVPPGSELSPSNSDVVATIAPPVEIDALALQLQQGKIRPEALNFTSDQLTKLIDIFIATETSIASDIQADLIAAVHQQAQQTNNKVDYYQRILTLLVRKEMLDLILVSEQVNQQRKPDQKVLRNNPVKNGDDEKSSTGKSQRAVLINEQPTDDQPLVAGATTSSQFDYEETIPTRFTVHQHDIAQPTFTQRTGAEITASNNIDAIVRALLAEAEPLRRLQTLQFDLAQWQAVVAQLIQQTQSNDKESGAELINAIQHQSRQVLDPANYYRRVIAAVLAQESIDLDAFSHDANSSTKLMSDQLPANPYNYVQQVNSPITAVTNTKVIAQALLTEPQSWVQVQQLQLEDRQWETLATELIQQSQFTDQHSAAELIEAIQAQARVAITPAVYYRLVIQAVLQQQPIDLEAFATTAIDVKQLSPIHGEYRHINTNTDSTISADNSIYQNMSQFDAGKFAVEELNPEEFTTALLNANQIDTSQINTSQINASQFSSVDISQHRVHPNNVNPNHVNPDQVTPEQTMDYPLLTGSDNSLHKPALSLAQLLAAELPLNQEQLLALQQHINALLNRSNPAIITEWCELLAVVQHAHVLIHSVPAHLLHQIAMRLQANRYTWLDALVKLVMEALALLVTDINNLTIKQAKWEFVFNYLFAADNTNNNTAETSARALELSIELCEQLASAAGIDDEQRLVNLTQRRIALLKPPAQQKPAMRLQDITTNPATHSDATTPQWEAGLHINNAGQVLAAAFLPRLFSMLNLMQDGKFIHLGAADRAVHLVQFMVTGQSATPEYDLILNKILCGIGTSIPVSAGIEITEQEQTLIEQMLNSMIQHWKVLGSTSITGLRETFFQRQGWLVLEEDCWRLKVKEQTFDLLLDRLPWSISLIKHGWMDKPVRVSWRNHS